MQTCWDDLRLRPSVKRPRLDVVHRVLVTGPATIGSCIAGDGCKRQASYLLREAILEPINQDLYSVVNSVRGDYLGPLLE